VEEEEKEVIGDATKVWWSRRCLVFGRTAAARMGNGGERNGDLFLFFFDREMERLRTSLDPCA
jgi:hypothetical protein